MSINPLPPSKHSLVGALTRCVALLALLGLTVAPAGATTLVRSGLDHLVHTNSSIVVGEVVDSYSYWNEDASFILTDVHVMPQEVLKGQPQKAMMTVTLMGGTVGDLSTLILGGASLEIGSSYVLFLDRSDLPGARNARTVSAHCQGVFEIKPVKNSLRATSQANDQPLVPDALGYVDAPGGVEGFPLTAMVDSIREIVASTRNEEAVQ